MAAWATEKLRPNSPWPARRLALASLAFTLLAFALALLALGTGLNTSKYGLKL